MSRSRYNRVGQVWADEHWVYYILESKRERTTSKWWHHLCMRLDGNCTMILMCETRDRPWGQSWHMQRVV